MEPPSRSPSMTPNIGPAFLRLPEEVLTLFVRPYVELHANIDCGESLALKTLRRVHPRLAYLRSLCRWLFRFIVVSPDPNRSVLEDWDFIGPFVKEVYIEPVVFLDPEVPWLSEQAISARESDLQAYYRHFDSGGAERILVDLMNSLPNLSEVTLLSNAKDSQITIPGPTEFVAFATRCLSRADVNLQELEFRNTGIRELWDMGALASWIASPINEKLNLCKLTTLSLELQNSCISGNEESDHQAFRTIAQALCRILEKCQHSLKTLSIATRAAIVWHPNVIAPKLDALASVHLLDCKLEASSLGEWLLSCETLEKLTLEGVSLRDDIAQNGLQLWKPLFDAIRYHPKRIIFEALGLEVKYDYTVPTGGTDEEDFTTTCLRYVQDTSDPNPFWTQNLFDVSCGENIAILAAYAARTGVWQVDYGV